MLKMRALSVLVCCFLVANAGRNPRSLKQSAGLPSPVSAGSVKLGTKDADAEVSAPPSQSATNTPTPLAAPALPLLGNATGPEDPGLDCRQCPKAREPVCAQLYDPFEVRTFYNRCFASCKGVRVLFDGECAPSEASPSDPSPSPSPASAFPLDPPPSEESPSPLKLPPFNGSVPASASPSSNEGLPFGGAAGPAPSRCECPQVCRDANKCRTLIRTDETDLIF
ncbi:hypothetical protein DUNSADRAFT_16413 [Dunaliella salina]|uniref:Kazal-like domain-containing protein n=1 Tax=Dunaliella salina TaxID=3046 RepID=A0ABQ7G3L7_DUNSA|nr:hypothetical protein DUNSADRAFT_16413 [Dunaliella salina]|eukprot:KAF5829191.1 hypothetical protein DUNSADRAFT_16413 [Dunaliella salina]